MRQQASPQPSPGRRPGSAHAPASTASPGAPILAAAARCLALLACAAAQQPLPPAGLALMSDLVQLLFYHAPPATADAAESTQPSSPLIAVSAQSSPCLPL